MNTRSASALSDNSAPQPVSLLARFTIPLVLAMLASVLNAMIVKKQIARTPAWVWTRDLPVGTVPTASDVEPTSVAGNFDKSLLANAEIVQQLSNAGELVNQQASPILAHSVTKGELLTKSSLDGRGTVQAGSNQELIHVPRSIIEGHGKGLVPGQLVYFIAFTKRSNDKSEPFEIGPFQVAVERRSDPSASPSDRDSICLIYPLDANGERGKSAKRLLETIFSGNCGLAVIEKPLPIKPLVQP